MQRTLSRAAALVSALGAMIVAVSCHDSSGPKIDSAVRLTTHLDTIWAIGDTVRLAVNGPDSSVVWEIRDPAVLRVTQAGRVTGLSLGEAWVLAFRDPMRADSARIVVRQRVSSIVVTPSAISRPLNRTQQFHAEAVDAHGVPVPNVLVSWSATGDAATIGTTGVATANKVGVATVSATANGITGTAHLTVSPLPSLRFSSDTIDVGVGQVIDNAGVLPRIVADSISDGETFTATIDVSDASIAAVSPLSIAMSSANGPQSSAVLGVAGLKAGIAKLTVTGGLYNPGTAVVRVSTPRLLLTVQSEWSTNLASDYLTVVLADSLGDARTMSQPLAIHLQARTAGVVSPSDTILTVPPGQTYTDLALQRGDSGQTWVVLSAPGYPADSVFVRLTARKLRFVRYDNSDDPRESVGAGEQHNGNLFVYVGCCVPTDLPITITQLHAGFLQTPHSLLEPAMDYYGRVQLFTSGLQAGMDTLIASAPGYLPDTLPFTVTTPTYVATGAPSATTVGAYFVLSAFVGDSLGVIHFPTSGSSTALVTSSNPSVLRPDSDTLTIGNTTGGGAVGVHLVGPGTATLTLRDAAGRFAPVTTKPITVAPSSLTFTNAYAALDAQSVGMHQLLATSLGIRTGGSIPDSIRLRTSDPTVANPSVGATKIGASFAITGGDRSGTAWIVASVPGLDSDSMLVSVGAPTIGVNTPLSGIAGQSAPYAVTIVLYDQTGQPRAASEDVTFHIVSTNPNVVTADSTITMVAGQVQSSAAITVRYVGVGTAVLRVVDDRQVPYAYQAGASSVIQVNAPPGP